MANSIYITFASALLLQLSGLSECLINRDLPSRHPLVVQTSVFIEDVSDLKSSAMEFDIEYLMRQKWRTNITACRYHYLQYLMPTSSPGPGGPGGSSPVAAASSTPQGHFIVSGLDLKGFWTPSTYAPEAKKVTLESSASTNRVLNVFVSQKDCVFEYQVRLDATLSCKTDFKHYPNDMQVCSFRMRSNSYNSSLVRYVWDRSGVILESNADKLNQFEMRLNYSSMYSAHDTEDEDFSWLVINFIFERRLSHFLIQIVAPSVLLLAVAYCSCWIRLDSGPGRYLLTILTLLSLVTIYNGYKSELPRSSRILAADVWMFACMLFIFSTIVELTLVAYVDKRAKQRLADKANGFVRSPKNRKSCSSFVKKADMALKRMFSDGNNNPGVKSSATQEKLISPDNLNELNGPFTKIVELNNLANSGLDLMVDVEVVKSKKPIDRAYQIDVIFRAAFPLAFLVFNCVYWPLLRARNLL